MYYPHTNSVPITYCNNRLMFEQGAIVASLDQIEGFEPMHEDWGTESGDQIDVVGCA